MSIRYLGKTNAKLGKTKNGRGPVKRPDSYSGKSDCGDESRSWPEHPVGDDSEKCYALSKAESR
jgi:hypothetical protein